MHLTAKHRGVRLCLFQQMELQLRFADPRKLVGSKTRDTVEHRQKMGLESARLGPNSTSHHKSRALPQLEQDFESKGFVSNVLQIVPEMEKGVLPATQASHPMNGPSA